MIAATLAIIVWGALAFGAVYPWAYTPLLAACAVLGIVGCVRRGAIGRAGGWTIAALAVVLVAALLQLAPLSASTVARVSPATDAFLRNYDFSYGLVGQAASHTISIAPRATVLGIVFLAAFTLFLAGLTRTFSRGGVKRLTAGITTFGVVLAIIAIAQKAMLGDDVYSGMRIYGVWAPQYRLVTPFGPYVNRNHFAGWMLMALPLALASVCAELEDGFGRVRPGWRNRVLWLSSPEGGRSVLFGFAVVVMALSLVMSMSRSGMACFAAALAIVGWRFVSQRGSHRGRALGVAVFTLLLAVPAIWLGVGSTVDRFAASSESMQTRLHAWHDARQIVRDFPLTGTGLNTYGTATVLYQTGSREVHFQEAHNDYLQLLAEGGLLIAIPAIAAVLLFGRAVRRRFAAATDDRYDYWLRVGAVAGLCAIALQSLVEFSLQMPGNTALFVVLAAIALHPAPQIATRTRSRQSSRRSSYSYDARDLAAS